MKYVITETLYIAREVICWALVTLSCVTIAAAIAVVLA